MTDEKLLSDDQKALKEHLDAIVSDVIVADKCYFLLKEISDRAEAINKANFGELFGFLQNELLSMYTLTLARFFELPKRYQIRGIPATLDFLNANRDKIPFVERAQLVKELGIGGMDAAPDADLTRSAVEVMRAKLPNTEGTQLFDALDAILFRRDKKIAHNEIVDPDEMPHVTWGKTQEMLNVAKTVVAAIGGGYFGISFKSYFVDGTVVYMLERDAGRTAVALNRLLRNAKVIEEKDDS